MHRYSMAFACVAAVFVAHACLAQSHPLYSFIKADTNEEQFRHDRDACVATVTTASQGGSETHLSYVVADTPGGMPQMRTETTVYSPSWPARNTDTYGFLRCMAAKGYQQSAPAMPAGKAGLYELQRFSNSAIFSRRDLSNTLPQYQGRASAEALARPGAAFQLCVPPDGTQQLGAVAGLSANCTYSNVVSTPHGFSADANCHQGQTTHVTFEATTPDRSEFTVWQRMPNAAVPHIDKYQINWISSDCGKIPPKTVRAPDGKLLTMANPQPTIKSFATTLP